MTSTYLVEVSDKDLWKYRTKMAINALQTINREYQENRRKKYHRANWFVKFLFKVKIIDMDESIPYYHEDIYTLNHLLTAIDAKDVDSVYIGYDDYEFIMELNREP